MTIFYAIGGGNWADATLNGGNGLFNSAADGSGAWTSPSAGDIADVQGNAVVFDVVTDQSITGGIACEVLDSVGGGSLTITDTTSSGTPLTLNDGAALDSGLSFSTAAQCSTTANSWVRLGVDLATILILGDGTVCVLQANQSQAMDFTYDGGPVPVLFLTNSSYASGGFVGDGGAIPIFPLTDPSTVVAGTTYAIASGYGGPGGMVGTAATPGTPDAGSMLSSYTYEGVTGNVVLPTEAQVQSGVSFGPASGLTGSYAGAGPVGGGSVIGSSIVKASRGAA